MCIIRNILLDQEGFFPSSVTYYFYEHISTKKKKLDPKIATATLSTQGVFLIKGICAFGILLLLLREQ